MESAKGQKTRASIIGAAKKLFGTKTYDYVTTRMIAKEAHCSQSAISFYFTTKENLCAAVIEDILKYHKLYFTPIVDSMNECVRRGEMTQERAFGYLQQYLNIQLDIAFDPRNRCAISFSINGDMLPAGLVAPLNESVQNNVTMPVAQLLGYYAGISLPKALVYSQTLADCIVIFPFTGADVRKELIRLNGDPEDDKIASQMVARQSRQYLYEICLQLVSSMKYVEP